MSERVNITPILNQILGLNQVKTPEQMKSLIEALRSMKEGDIPSFAEMAQMMKRISKKKVA